VRGVGEGLEIFFDSGADVVGFEGATEAGENLAVGIEEDGVGDGFHGFDEIECFGSREDEGVADAMAFGENEEAGSGGVVEADAEQNEALGGVLFLEGGEFRKFFGGGGAPSGPEVEEDEFSAEDGGVEGLAAG